jgi:acetolactate synthase-1/2/3 large subunit
VAAAAALLADAERPVIFAGNGVTLGDAIDELAELARLLQAPVATTLMGKGMFPETDPLSVGTTGIWGTRAANDTTRDADVILAVGTAFGEADCSSWRPDITFAIPGSKLVQIDIDPGEIGKSYPVDVGIVGDAKATLRALIDRLGPSPRPAARTRAQLQDVTRRKRDWQAEVSESQSDAGTPIHPARLLRALSEAAPEDANLRHRRRLEQERCRPAAAGEAAAVVHHERRHGDDGLFSRGRHRRQARRA